LQNTECQQKPTDLRRSTSTSANPNPKPSPKLKLNLNPSPKPNPNPFLSYPHGNEMKCYGSCALIITISDFRGPPK